MGWFWLISVKALVTLRLCGECKLQLTAEYQGTERFRREMLKITGPYQTRHLHALLLT